MNMLQFSTRQLFIVLAATAFATVAVFMLGLTSASLIADQPGGRHGVALAAQLPDTAGTAACEPIIPIAAAGGTAAQADTARPATQTYGVQIAVFDELENAIAFAARHSDSDFHARIFSRAAAPSGTVYPVLIGLFDTMDAAQQAKLSFHARFAADSFVTDATRLRGEITLNRTLAMLP